MLGLFKANYFIIKRIYKYINGLILKKKLHNTNRVKKGLLFNLYADL